MLRALPVSQPARLPDKSTDGARTPRPRHRFEPGNHFGGRRRPVDAVEEVNRICKETVNRLRRPQYDYEEDEHGKRIRIERAMDASKANPLANLLRLRLEVHAQFAVGELVRRQQDELEQLRAVVAQLLEARS
jgi:hypothetical protein